MKNNLIYRSFDNIIASSEGRTIEGLAVVFESWSKDLGGFKEIIHRSALTQDIIDKSDIIMNLDHNNDTMVARSRYGKGTLNLELRDDGLYFSFEAPPTQRGDELLYNVRSGNLFECSFCFTLPKNDTCQTWEYNRSTDSVTREINEIAELFDCAICVHGAYGDTNVYSRSNEEDEYCQSVIKELRSQEEEEEEDKPEDEETPKTDENEEEEVKNDEETNPDEEEQDEEKRNQIFAVLDEKFNEIAKFFA